MKVCEIPGANLNISRGEFPNPDYDTEAAGEQLAVLGGGCFWCTEAVYRQLDGVLELESGYAGGTAETADYRKVCSGGTDHAEVIRIRFAASRISFGQILRVFFSVAHDPTQLNRQGNDIGRQYRSAIFSQNEAQAEVARRYIAQLNGAQVFRAPIQTTVEQGDYFPAEAYHQDYAAQNPNQAYIAATTAPKVAKLRERYQDLLKRPDRESRH